MPSTDVKAAIRDLRKYYEKDYRGFNIFFKDAFFKASLKRKYTPLTLQRAKDILKEGNSNG